MINLKWLNEKKEMCERGIEFYQNKVNEYKKDLGMIRELIDLAERQSGDARTAQRQTIDAAKDKPISQI